MPLQAVPLPAHVTDLVAAPRAWMVRAGRQGVALGLFLDRNRVAVGWGSVGDLSAVASRDSIRAVVAPRYANASAGKIGAVTGCLLKIRSTIAVEDAVMTYDSSSRTYSVGLVQQPYAYEPNTEFGHWRGVTWVAELARDDLGAAAKHRLGSLLTVFEIEAAAWEEIKEQLIVGARPAGVTSSGTDPVSAQVPELAGLGAGEEEAIDPVAEALELAHEYRKDAISALGPNEMEDFVACVLRGMGYRARVTPRGPDRGRDIEASPDGLGLEEPRIRVEVKHRQAKMGAQEVRAFLGALRPGDKGLYVSTGGFSREAMYEAERSQVPASLVDLDRLAELYVEFYEVLKPEDRELVPLRRVYWPEGRG